MKSVDFEEKMTKEAFEEAIQDWTAHDDWQFADKKASWKWFWQAALEWAAKGQEPIAWAALHEDGSANIFQQKETAEVFGKVVPLYLHPTPEYEG